VKIVYRGGYNKEIVQNSLWFDYLEPVTQAVTSGQQVALITLAKPDGYFDNFVLQWPQSVQVINHQTPNSNWQDFDVIIIPGGDPLSLHDGLTSRNFALEKLKETAVVVGDSAGAYVLSSYFYNSPRGEERGKVIDFLPGFNPEAKVITVGHVNNPKYTNTLLLEKVNTFAQAKGLTVLKLNENQEKLLGDNNEFIDFDRSTLF
jgi:hypothetical protein